MKSPRAGTGFKLRTKLFVLFPLLLSIPYLGYQYIAEMEAFLRRALEQSVLTSARALAVSLHERVDGFRNPLSNTDATPIDAVYAHPLPAPIEVDGYLSDWDQHLSERQPVVYDRSSDTEPGSDNRKLSADARYVTGVHDGYLFVLVTVIDDKVVYRGAGAPLALLADQLLLALRDRKGELRRYAISTVSPGSATTFQVPERRSQQPTRIEVRVRAAWQQTADGYNVELRLPLSMVGPELGLSIIDVDTQPATADIDAFGVARLRYGRHPVVLPSAEMTALIQRAGSLEGRRVWIVDRAQQVLARGGSLERKQRPRPINPIYGLLLRPPSDEIFQASPVRSRLDGKEVAAALTGKEQVRWRATAEENLWVVSAGFPVFDGDKVVGAVVVEETSLGIQTLTREALANLFNKTLLVCLVGALLLALFASRIVTRLRRLSAETEAAIDAHGRVVGELSGKHGSDEIGELADNFADMMKRLKEYNTYLENLARRLSHELRTPIAVVRSSLEALELAGTDPTSLTYANRARDGLVRLDKVITRMSEAARLEEAIAAATPEQFDLVELLTSITQAYAATWPKHRFEFASDDQPVLITGVPELLVEMLDKLVSNAVELGSTEQPLQIELTKTAATVRLRVVNYGSSLPEPMQAKLFESMVSIREPGRSGEPHLGLGLYIARLIVDFHNGSIRAANLPSKDGVEVIVELPRA